MDLQHQLPPKLKQLRLSGILATLDARTRQAYRRQVVVYRVSGAPPGRRGGTAGAETTQHALAPGHGQHDQDAGRL